LCREDGIGKKEGLEDDGRGRKNGMRRRRKGENRGKNNTWAILLALAL
jgi:hypothetical protein